MRSVASVSRYVVVSISLAALLLITVVGFAVFYIQTKYFDYFPYFFDHVYYTYFNVRVHEEIARDGQFAVAWEEWFSNGRHPLRTAPLVILAPQLLTAQLGHLATSLPFLFAFIALLGLYVHRRTGSLWYALAAMGLFMAMPGWLDPRQGLGAYWLETAASPLLGSAVICLLMSDRARRLRWLAGFAMFAALACLSRYVTVAFVVVLCGPIVVVWLARRTWEERNPLQSIVLPCIVIGIISGILAGPFLYKHTPGNIEFYSSLGPVGQGHLAALKFTVHWVNVLAGSIVLGTLITASVVLLIAAYRTGYVAWGSLMLSTWFATALIAMLVLQGAAEARHVVWFVIPPLFLALIAPVPLTGVSGLRESSGKTGDPIIIRPRFTPDDPEESTSELMIESTNVQKGRTRDSLRRQTEARSVLALLSAMLGVVAIGVFSWSAIDGWQNASRPPDSVAGQKALDVGLAKILASQGPGLVWNAYFDEYAWVPTMETYYRFGQLVLPAGQPFYHYHAPHWAFEYPGYSPEALGARIAEGTTRLVDIAVVLDDPHDADTNEWMTNPHSRAVSRMVTEEVEGNPVWVRIGTLDSTQYGKLAVYRNQGINGVGYERALRNRLAP